MGCRRKLRIALKILITLSCFLVCSYQVYLVGKLYLSYPTTVDLRIGRSLNVHLPGITICSEISTTILPQKIIEIQPTLYPILHGRSQREILYLLRKKTFRQLLEEPLRRLPINLQHKMTISSVNFFDKCEVPTPLGYQKGLTYSYTKVNCSVISKIVETISFDKKCFTLFYNNEENFDQNNYQIKRDSAANLKYLAWIRINRDYVLNGLLYIHSPKELHQFSDGNNVLQLNPTKDQFIALSFTRQTTTLLPPPYATQCKNYSHEGFTSREHCLAQCKVEAYTDSDGWPGDIFATPDITYTFSKLWMNSKSPSGHLEEGLSLDELCRQVCGDYEDCHSVFYDVKQLRVEERDDDDYEQNQWITIGILPPKTVDMNLVHLPKYEPIELAVSPIFFKNLFIKLMNRYFLSVSVWVLTIGIATAKIYLGGLINLYLGFSVVAVMVALFTFITFTGTPFDKKKKKIDKNYKQTNGYEMKPINGKTNIPTNDSENNNKIVLNRRRRDTEEEDIPEPLPRAKLPGILHFMFET